MTRLFFLMPLCDYSSLLQNKDFAIIVARIASLNACKLAERYSCEISEVGFKIIFRMARGIDAAAHLIITKTGTIAFLANGVGSPQLRRKITLFLRLIEEGIVLSEMPFVNSL